MTGSLDLRRSAPGDLPAVLELLALTLGNRGADDPAAEMFAWKHLDNPFGRSPSWVATDAGRVVAFRTFMRWRFRWGRDVVSAVRAVDTVTHPGYRGRGLFRSLTMLAVEELTGEGVGFVFNTPNDQSRPGYLTMGWKVVGRLPIAARSRGPAGASRMVGARQPAALWSDQVEHGTTVSEWLDAGGVVVPEQDGNAISTEFEASFLRWRYGFAPLHYRVARVGHGDVVFRVRQRGSAKELAVLQNLGSGRPRVGPLLAAVGADYAVGLGTSRPAAALPLPRQGPLLTWRALARHDPPRLADWGLCLGDVELF